MDDDIDRDIDRDMDGDIKMSKDMNMNLSIQGWRLNWSNISYKHQIN